MAWQVFLVAIRLSNSNSSSSDKATTTAVGATGIIYMKMIILKRLDNEIFMILEITLLLE